MAGHLWTTEKLSALDLAKLKTVRANAERMGVAELIRMCDEALSARRPTTEHSRKTPLKSENGDIVIEYHFVCREDRGVTFNPDGTFWSASWVVAEDVLKKSIRFGAKLALHNSKLDHSYRQGSIKDYRRVEDFADGKVESRIDFLVVAEHEALPWAGTGAGEKGYKRAKSSGNEATSNSIVSEES